MIVTKETGVIYSNGLTKEVILFHKENSLTIAEVNRKLTYNDGVYKDDITNEEVMAGGDEVRKFRYINESDPLFFKFQRGLIAESEWLNKVNEIKGLQ